MAVPKANQRAVNKYVKANYDRINVTMPKGEKEVIQAHAAALGESVNGFIVRSIRERMERASPRGPQKAAEGPGGSGGIPVSPDMLEVVQRAAGATGETVSEFVIRAVETTEQLDKGSLSLGISPVEAWRKEKEKKRKQEDFLKAFQKASETK